MRERTNREQRAFTLTEILIVVALIGVLAVLLLPALNGFRNKGRRATCVSNLRQISIGLRMYADDSSDMAPRTPGTESNPALNWSGYKALMKKNVGINGASPANGIFACPADTFFYNLAENFQYVPHGLHTEAVSDFSSYAFNGGNARTNSNAPGIAGRTISSIKEPSKTVLVAEASAFTPWSWHEPKTTAAGAAPMFNDAKNIVGFVDGHVSYIKMFWPGNNPPGTLALHRDPPASYNYKWSGD